MMRCAVTVLLVFSFPSLIFAQHRGEGGASSGSSSGGSSGGYSGGYSGGSSGGGYSGSSSGSSSHSSSSSGSGSSGGYSGSSSGGSQSSASSGASRSGGYSASGSSSSRSSSSSSAENSHSSGRSGGELPSSNSRNWTTVIRTGSRSSTSSEQTPARSNVRVGDGVETPGNGASQQGGLRAVSDAPWMHEVPSVSLPVGNLAKMRGNQEFASKLEAVGLEPSKSAYKGTISSINRATEERRPSWIARLFGAKSQPVQSAALRPCPAGQCKPTLPPKPCAGPNCPKPKPTPSPTPLTGICTNGYDAGGYCAPWGYVQSCEGRNCNVRYSSVDAGYCDRILDEINREKASLKQLEDQQRTACSGGAQDPQCGLLTQSVQAATQSLQQYRMQYQMCRMAAHLP